MGEAILRGCLTVCWTVIAAGGITAQEPGSEQAQRHHRVSRVEPAGRRVELGSLKGAVLYVPGPAEGRKSLPLIVHFHGAPWLVQHHVATHLPRAAVITVQLGSGSSVYGRPFQNTQTFRTMTDEARAAAKLKRDWSSITLTGFSAGYGAIRAILRDAENLARVDNVLLLDGIHASYSPEGVPPVIKADDVDSFVAFARLAVAGKKAFVITHSAIRPGTYASTTECSNLIVETLGLNRRLLPGDSITGMRQRTVVDARGFHIRGYTGTTAADHVDYLHSMAEWFPLLKI